MKTNPKPPYNPLARVSSDETPRREAWEEACRIAEWIGSRHPDAKIFAFGSIVRKGAWNPRSDIDLAASGLPDPTFNFEMEIQDAFPGYRVQLIDKDRILRDDTDSQEPEERDPEAKEFFAEVVQTGIEIPSPFPLLQGPPEILEIPKRLASSIRRTETWLREIQESAALAAKEPEKEMADVLLDAVRWESMRYRVHLERGLSRVLGYIDRLAFDPNLDEDDERIRLYKIASRDGPGIRPALITKRIADWHSKYVKLEFALMDKAEKAPMIEAHVQELPAIHEEAKASFEAFAHFLENWQSNQQ